VSGAIGLPLRLQPVQTSGFPGFRWKTHVCTVVGNMMEYEDPTILFDGQSCISVAHRVMRAKDLSI
jgi:hypothetical protein